MTNRVDNFNRADNASLMGSPSDGGSAWSAVQGTFGIVANTGYDSGGFTQYNVAALESSVANVEVQVTLSTVGSGTAQGLSARLADISNFLWAAYIPGSGVVIRKVVAGSETQLGSAAHTASNGDVLKFSVDGNTLNLYVNGVLKVGPITESAGATNTKHGLFTYSENTARFDDFSITEIGGGGGGGNGAAAYHYRRLMGVY